MRVHFAPDLFHKDGEALVLEGLGEVQGSRSLRVDGERRHYQVSLVCRNKLPYHAIPGLFGGVLPL